MYFFTFHCSPRSGSANSLEFGGAYINCWININEEMLAEETAKRQIQQLDWIVLQKEEVTLVDDNFYSIESEGRKYYEQALIDNWVIVQHTYPSEEDQSIAEWALR